MEIRKARPRAIRTALRISISGDKFPAGGKELQGFGYIRYFGIMPGYCATLKTLSSFSLNAAISCLILSLVILA